MSTLSVSAPATLRIWWDRLQARLNQLNQIGALEGGGVCRLALTQQRSSLTDSLSSQENQQALMGFYQGNDPNTYEAIIQLPNGAIERGQVQSNSGIRVGDPVAFFRPNGSQRGFVWGRSR